MADLTYKKGDLFATFLPETSAGEVAWRELAAVTEGTGKVWLWQLAACLKGLKSAGYTVQRVTDFTVTVPAAHGSRKQRTR